MRADPDVGPLARAAEEVPGRVDLDLETGLAHPARRQLVRLVLGRGCRAGGSRPGPPPIAYSASSRSKTVTRAACSCAPTPRSSRASGRASARRRSRRRRSARCSPRRLADERLERLHRLAAVARALARSWSSSIAYRNTSAAVPRTRRVPDASTVVVLDREQVVAFERSAVRKELRVVASWPSPPPRRGSVPHVARGRPRRSGRRSRRTPGSSSSRISRRLHAHRVAVCRRSSAAPSSHQPASGTSAANANAAAQDAASTLAAKTIGATTPLAARTVCWTPIAAPVRTAPGELGGRGEREPVPGHRQPAREDQRRDEEPRRPAGQQRPSAASPPRSRGRRAGAARPALPAGPTSALRRRETTAASTWPPAKTSAAACSEKPCSSTRKSTPKPMTAICA